MKTAYLRTLGAGAAKVGVCLPDSSIAITYNLSNHINALVSN